MKRKIKTYQEKEDSSMRLDMIKETIDALVLQNGFVDSPDAVVYYACLNCGYLVEKLPLIEVVALKNYAVNCMSQA